MTCNFTTITIYVQIDVSYNQTKYDVILAAPRLHILPSSDFLFTQSLFVC